MSLPDAGISAADLGSRLPKRVAESQIFGRRKRRDLDHELASVIYRYVNDVPEDVMNEVTDAVMTVVTNPEIGLQRQNSQIEELLGQAIAGDDLERIFRIAEQKLVEENNSDDSDLVLDDDEEEPESEDEAVAEEPPKFIALNDPIRIKTHASVKPEEIDELWLERRLSGSGVSVADVLSSYEPLAKLSLHDRQLELERLLGPSRLGLAQLLSRNWAVIVLYTKLALAEDKESVQTEIQSLDLTHAETMNEELPQCLDLSSVGRPAMSYGLRTFELPENSTKVSTTLYEQFNVPPPPSAAVADWPLIKIADLPSYAQSAFKGLRSLNLAQSRVAAAAVDADVNMLVCAPTGAGKTNMALLAIMRCLNESLKVVYISPQRALVQEQVRTLQDRLPEYTVIEVSGDSDDVSRFQLASANVIVSTPEKWDIVSRKGTNAELLRTVGLVVLDEIHLLHSPSRGGVIENIVLRHAGGPRLIGLSATLPNYEDVARFLQVPPAGLFYFDASFRPVPLEQQFVGIRSTASRARNDMDKVCVEKVREIAVNKQKRLLVFVHSRQDTTRTRELLAREIGAPLEIGVHHAGMKKDARRAAETAFSQGDTNVLVCTATLAWGVNLPAAAVMIKGTQFYNPTAGRWQQLEPQDILQMLGRAGRPGFDAEGLGVIITSHDCLSYVASVSTMSCPIESHLMFRIMDSVNAEVCLRKIRNLDEGCEWLEKSFWSIRWRADPFKYGDDYRLVDVIHSVFLKLQSVGSAVYEYPNIRPTGLGELAANFYVAPEEMTGFSRAMQSWYSESEILEVLAKSQAFESLAVRSGEASQIEELIETVPLPIKANSYSSVGKINALLQAYISRLPLRGTTLQNDAVFIAQSASRLARCLFELAVELNWGLVARAAHRVYAMIEGTIWAGQSPFRQFAGFPEEVARNAEQTSLQWLDYFNLSDADLAKILKTDNLELVEQALAAFPRFEVKAVPKSLFKDWLVLHADIESITEPEPEQLYSHFSVLIENPRGELVYSCRLTWQQIVASRKHKFHIHLREWPPYLYLKILGDQWLNYHAECSISLRSVVVPSEEGTVYTLEQERPTDGIPDGPTETNGPTDDGLGPDSTALTRVLTPLLLESDRSVCIGLPPGTEQYMCAQMVIKRAQKLDEQVMLLYADEMFDAEMEDFHGAKVLSVRTAARSLRNSSLEYEFAAVDTLICFGINHMDAAYELLVTRMLRYWNQAGLSVRVVCLGEPVNSIGSLGSWIKAKKADTVNFELSLREPTFPDVEIQAFNSQSAFSTCLRYQSVAHMLALKDLKLIITSTRTQKKRVLRELDAEIMTSVRVAVQNESFLGDLRPGEYSHIILFDVSSEDLVSLVGLATARAIVFTREPEYCSAILSQPQPLESELDTRFCDALLPEILEKTVVDPQSALEFLTSTFLYRRARANPGYYGITNIQFWASELVQSSFEKLAEFEVVEMDEELNVSPLELCQILVHSGATFENLVSVRSGQTEDVQDVATIDQCITLSVAINAPLSRLFQLIDMRQSKAQSLPLYSSSLLQIPNVDDEVVLRCQDARVSSLMDFIGIEDDDLRSTLLGFNNDDPRMLDVANFVNSFPIVDIVDVVIADSSAKVTVERDTDDGDDGGQLNWFIVIGDPANDTVSAFKRVHLTESVQSFDLLVTGVSAEGKVWLLCGDYIDADKERTLNSDDQ